MDKHAFVLTALKPALPPPRAASGPLKWLRARLFAGPVSTVLTLVSLAVLWLIVPPLLDFLVFDAVWRGSGREACLAETVGRPVGACWPFIWAKLGQLTYGFYPADERWRVNLVFAAAVALLVPLLIPSAPFKRLNAALFFVAFPLAAFALLVGGRFGLAYVETRAWGGLLVTLVVAVTGIVASLPLGILLALGRRSSLPVVRWLAVAVIEVWRGVPLITVLFFATYMLPLFLPGSWTIDALLRVLIGVAVFAAAYMAEVVRGGLQGVPRAQYEGAIALGLGHWQTMVLVVLPQALKLVIPGIVNTFIGLFKDTTLVMIVAIFDLLGQLRAAFADPAWASPSTLYTGFAFAGLIYFSFCFGMSRYALFIERRLDGGRR
ncbi:amino acid ABC transporter permease [Blastochloris viridis]|uniref:Glutamate Aspartate transport system permease protein GltK n=1 Tax=Blastochloris viridis TaxID=1079 RepID=A0A0H5BJW3_BLAVI|nr:amino acid ABC transporter permease [Blastochloris viridis]ALK09312.1 Inner membrane amino-acid ABC transporter permease protein YhdY [Blastochloris viridis]BAS00812.1 glutamate Aspartate transport system permease protein GltK [Blastochloris viridis]CUU41975.1 Inner membrane amino-acid ABC transporter permease protein yhdY [Blastochloris viridis]